MAKYTHSKDREHNIVNYAWRICGDVICYVIRHNIILLWFVEIYERNLKKLQLTTQRFDTPV